MLFELQAASGRMSARITVVETNQAEFRNQLSELMMTCHNNEQSLKSCGMQLDNLATVVISIMKQLESKIMMSPPHHSGANQCQIPRSPPSQHARFKPNLNRLVLVHVVVTR